MADVDAVKPPTLERCSDVNDDSSGDHHPFIRFQYSADQFATDAERRFGSETSRHRNFLFTLIICVAGVIGAYVIFKGDLRIVLPLVFGLAVGLLILAVFPRAVGRMAGPDDFRRQFRQFTGDSSITQRLEIRNYGLRHEIEGRDPRRINWDWIAGLSVDEDSATIETREPYQPTGLFQRMLVGRRITIRIRIIRDSVLDGDFDGFVKSLRDHSEVNKYELDAQASESKK